MWIFQLHRPIGTPTNGSLDLGIITLNQAGDYTFSSDQGCESILTINVDQANDPCSDGFTPQYTINGVVGSGDAAITVQEGIPLILGIVQSDITYTITLPDSSTNAGQLDLGGIVLAQAGTYSFASDTGCTAQLLVNVEENPDSGKQLKDVIIYPNPVSDGKVKFVLNDFMNETINVSFYDIYGKLVRQKCYSRKP